MRRSGLLLLALVACKPDLPERESIVRTERLLAVRAEPAESAPGDAVTYTALVASPSGVDARATVDWAFCAAPIPPGENGVVASACQRGESLRVLGQAIGPAAATLPDDACALFGPDAPPGGYRPVDPDATGGYYQPVVAGVAGGASFFLSRITCNLANAPAALAAQFGKTYVRNKNPRIADLAVPTEVPPGARVTWTVAWTAADAETYAVFDTASQSIVQKRESLRVSWFATAGDFDEDRTGAAEADAALASTNGWTAPSDAETVHAFVVLRDSRGGVDFAAKDLVVRAR